MRAVTAELLIKDAAKLTARQRKDMAEWLRQKAEDILKEADQYDKGFKSLLYG